MDFISTEEIVHVFYWAMMKMGLLVCNIKVCRGLEVFKGF